MNVGERLRLAIANPRFQVVMLVWAMALVTMLAFPFPQGFGIDLLFYRSALDAMLAGQSADMVVNPFATAASEWHLTPFFPPPIAALFGGSLMGLPGSIAAALAANVVVVGVAFVLMRRVTPPIPAVAWPGGRRARLTIALLGWFAFLPTIHGLWFGNVQTLALLGVALLAVGTLGRRPWQAGLGLAIATLFKLAPALFALPMAVGGRRRELAWALVFGLAGVLLTVFVVGLTPWFDFVRSLVERTGQVAEQRYNISPLGGTFPQVSPVAWVALAGAVMAMTGRLEARRMLAASIAILLLGWPIEWPHYAVIALVAFALLLPDSRTHLALGLAYVLLSAPWREAWAIGLILLLVAAVRPGWLAFGRGRATPAGRRPS